MFEKDTELLKWNLIYLGQGLLAAWNTPFPGDAFIATCSALLSRRLPRLSDIYRQEY
jgi:hypothetical protein